MFFKHYVFLDFLLEKSVLASIMTFNTCKSSICTNIIFLVVLWCFSQVSYAQQKNLVVGLENLDYLPYYQTNKADQ